MFVRLVRLESSQRRDALSFCSEPSTIGLYHRSSGSGVIYLAGITQTRLAPRTNRNFQRKPPLQPAVNGPDSHNLRELRTDCRDSEPRTKTLHTELAYVSTVLLLYQITRSYQVSGNTPTKSKWAGGFTEPE